MSAVSVVTGAPSATAAPSPTGCRQRQRPSDGHSPIHTGQPSLSYPHLQSNHQMAQYLTISILTINRELQIPIRTGCVYLDISSLVQTHFKVFLYISKGCCGTFINMTAQSGRVHQSAGILSPQLPVYFCHSPPHIGFSLHSFLIPGDLRLSLAAGHLLAISIVLKMPRLIVFIFFVNSLM